MSGIDHTNTTHPGGLIKQNQHFLQFFLLCYWLLSLTKILLWVEIGTDQCRRQVTTSGAAPVRIGSAAA
jgi:hypothetical protein